VSADCAQTKHPSRARQDRMAGRLAAAQGPGALETLDQVVAGLAPDLAASYLAALCNAWLGCAQRRWPRSDRGGWHQLPERVWDLYCAACGSAFTASRWDARYCSPACRQRAYRQRTRAQR
jgi:hypothetical protein